MSLLSALALTPPAVLLRAKQAEKQFNDETARIEQAIKQSQGKEAVDEQFKAALAAASGARKEAMAAAQADVREQLQKKALKLLVEGYKGWQERRAIASGKPPVPGSEDVVDDLVLGKGVGPKGLKAKPKISMGGFHGGSLAFERGEGEEAVEGKVTGEHAVLSGSAKVTLSWEQLVANPSCTVVFSFSRKVSDKFAFEVAKAGKGGGFEISSSRTIEVSQTRVLASRELGERYLESAKKAEHGGFAELKLALAILKEQAGDVATLVQAARSENVRLMGFGGAPPTDMKDGESKSFKVGDEQERSASGSLGAAGKPLLAGWGVQLGISSGRSGSVTREVARAGDSWTITLSAEEEESGGKTAGFSLGMVSFQAGSKNTTTRSRKLRFELDDKDPKLAERWKRITSAATVEQMLELHAALPDVAFTDLTMTSRSGGDGAAASIAGLAANVGSSTNRTSVTEKNAQGQVVKAEVGGRNEGSSLAAGPAALAGGGRTEEYSGTATKEQADGRAKATDSSGNLLGKLQQAVAHPLDALNALVGDGKLGKDKAHTEVEVLPDESYRALIDLARSPADWDFCGRQGGSALNFAAWQALRGKVTAASGDRTVINAAVADFEAGSNRRTHEILKFAVNRRAQTSERYELPPALAKYEGLYEQLAVGDPVEVAREAKKPAQVLAKLRKSAEQLEGLAKEVEKAIDAFRDQGVAMAMIGKLQGRLEQVETAIEEIEEGSGSDDAERALRRLPRLHSKIEAARGAEGKLFDQWRALAPGRRDEHLAAVHLQAQVSNLHMGWRKTVEELRATLAAAGAGYDPDDADRQGPDESTYRNLSHLFKIG